MNDEQAGLLSDGTYRAHWLRAVIKATHITDSVRVLLMALALHMDASGRVSVPREDLAALLGRNERKVAERVKLALESGLLLRTVRGQKHRVAVYQAAIDGVTLSMPPEGPAEDEVSVAPGDPVDSGLRVPDGGQAEDSQGAGSMHPEPNSQGAGSMHPETQGAGFSMPPEGPAEDSQGAPRGAHPSFIGVEVSEEVDLSDSGRLFDLKSAASRRPKETKSGTRRKPETPMPADFKVTPDMEAWAKAQGYTVDLGRETFRFINHAHQNDRRCRDWLAAWRNWIDKAQEISDRETRSSTPRPQAARSPGSAPQQFAEEEYHAGW
ncbi:hypothetical protein [Nonomuraea sp. NPDC049400]|uniref:hypothetical protein n=1 Tax=Nonomuraea sp. NPDC049400 TaxID=3364352 RepID=UPI0037BC1A54